MKAAFSSEKVRSFAEELVEAGRFFEGISATAIARLLAAGEREDLYPESPLLRLNEQSRNLLFVISGSYEVRSRNPFARRIVDAPEVANLSGAIAGRTASASLLAGPRGCTVIKVDGDLARPLFNANPDLFIRGWGRAFSYAESAERTLGILAASDSVVKLAGALVRFCDEEARIASGSILLSGIGPERLAKACMIDPRNASRALDVLAAPRKLKGPRARRLGLTTPLVVRNPKKRKEIQIPDVAKLRRWYDMVEGTDGQDLDDLAFAKQE